MEHKLIKSEIKLTVGILVSNRIKYIRRCMEALQPLLRAVPSELIAVDTKGAETDGSVAVVREYTDLIYPFKWCDDFAAARNVCLAHARGEWFLYLDDDEVFDDVSELIAFFNGPEADRYQSGYYRVKNYSKDGENSFAIVGRIIRRRENTCFVGRIHERFLEVFGPEKQFKTFVHHYGYAYDTPESEQAHLERNVRALRQELAEHGLTPRYGAQMVQELLSTEQTRAEGFRLYKEYVKELAGRGELSDACSQWLLVAGVRYYFMEGEYQKALLEAEDVQRTYPLSQTARMALAAVATRAAAEANDPEAVLRYAPLYLEMREWRRKHPKEALLQTQLDFPRYDTQEYCRAVTDVLRQARTMPKRSKLIRSNIKLTIGMLVSNHVKYIRNCMESVKPLLAAVPSELVVLDTKGEETDGSIAIVREYTDRIYPFTWCNDFSAARNALLSHARGEWFLYFDDDEWFDDVQEFIDFFQSGECEKYYSGYYYTRDYFKNGTYSMGIAGRMIRRTENTRFVGRVHENFEEVFAPNKEFSCFTHHYGYVYANAEERRKHQHRNLSILEEEIKEYGPTPQTCAQKVQELMSVFSTFDQGYTYCLESIDEMERQGKLEDNCSQWLIVASVRYFQGSKQYEKAIEKADFVRRRYELSEIAKLSVAAVAVECALLCGDTIAMAQYVPIYQNNLRWAEKHPKEALRQTQLDFPRFRMEHYQNFAWYAGALSSNAMQQYEMAYEYWQGLLWDKSENPAQYQQELLVTLRNLKDKTPLVEYYRHFYREEYFQPEQWGYLPRECRKILEGVSAGEDEEEVDRTDAKKEIVFLPYSASMWDCLESVYLAAAADPDCHAVVMPIPYYEKKEDGSLGEMHYDGARFPEGISITDYRTYSLAEHRPDVIYIHNAYDEYNNVTTVHPEFYSTKVKQYTKLLVYIPYFVSDTGKGVSDNMLFLPGIHHADRVIVESEAARQEYIRVYVERLGEQEREAAEKKILALGSPKYDKLMRTKKEDIALPPEWERRIVRPDGTRRKVILYNTSISTLGSGREKELAKIRDVLYTFKQQKEVVLLWRPHPLYRASVKRMLPDSLEEYDRIVAEYKAEGWGIFDESSDLDRALVVSDAYYGDASSLVALYKRTGKPIMIQNSEVLTAPERVEGDA